MKKHIALITLLIVIFSVSGQTQDEKGRSLDFGCELVSRYVWRGLNLGGNIPSAQPTIGLDFGKNKHAFTLGTFGAWSFGGQQIQEADLFLSYTYNETFTLIFTDYFFPMDDGSGPKYFDYRSASTGHLFEGTFKFEGSEKIPFSLLFAMNFYGADAKRLNADGTEKGLFMSKYVELGYSTTISEVTTSFFIGAALDQPDKVLGETTFYGNRSAGVINLGCKLEKEVKIGNGLVLPLNTQLVFNPEASRVFMVFGVTL
jgi:hypothetical protein